MRSDCGSIAWSKEGADRKTHPDEVFLQCLTEKEKKKETGQRDPVDLPLPCFIMGRDPVELAKRAKYYSFDGRS